jgi:hypothetical protein
MKIGTATAPETARKYSRTSPGPVGVAVGAMSITASAPFSTAARL